MPPSLRRSVGSVREFFSLAQARSTVRNRPPERHAVVRSWWRAARARLRIAEQLDPEAEFSAAIALYREGICALIGAGVAAVEGSVQSEQVAEARAAWTALERIWPDLTVGAPLGEFDVGRRALCEPTPLDGAAPSQAAASAICGELSRLARELQRAIEPRTAAELAASAALRKAVPIAVAVLALAGPVKTWVSPRDLALGRRVSQSSFLPSRAAEGGENLVNGKLEYTFGAHTDNTGDAGHPDPWMMIDLGAPTRIGKIAVYNRGDKDFTHCLPLILDVGMDPSSMKTLEIRKTLFTRTDPWVIDRLHETARYVRVRMTGNTYIALDEIAVYAP